MSDVTTEPTVRQNLDLAEAALTSISFPDDEAITAVARIRSARTILSQGSASKWLVLADDQLAIISDRERRENNAGIQHVYGRIVPDPDGRS